jgi:hypothetical protein
VDITYRRVEPDDADRLVGYVEEAHYRDAWPGDGGEVYDAVGYAILRRDWLAGTTTTPEWLDEHILTSTPDGSGSPGAVR